MAINNKTLSSIQSQVTGLTTNETDFRSGLDDTLVQVNASEILLSNVDAADLTKLSEITATSSELNILDGVTASTSEINKLDGLNATTAELNLLDGVTATTAEINLLDGITATKTEINKLDGFTGTYQDLNKIADVTATAAELNVLDGFTGTTADLERTVALDAAGNGTSGQVLTSDGLGAYSWTSPDSFTFVVEDEDGTEISVDTDELKFVGDGMTINWGTGDGTDGNPYQLQFDNSDKGSDQFIFKNIAVSGQTTIAADSNADTLTVAGGTGISVTTNASTDTLTFSVTGNSITADELNVTGDGTTAQYLRSDGDGSFTWATPPDTNTTYSAGSGLDLTGTTFSVESDLRSEVSFIGNSTSNYIESGSTLAQLVVGGVSRLVANTTGGYCTGNFEITGTLTETSDRRLKSEIEKIESGLEKVCKLSGYTFVKEGQDHRVSGVIAQEVLEVLPEAVTGSEDTNYSVAYGNMVGLLIEAIKDLKAEVEELKKK